MYIESRLTTMVGEGVEGSSKRGKGLMDEDSSVVITGE